MIKVNVNPYALVAPTLLARSFYSQLTNLRKAWPMPQPAAKEAPTHLRAPRKGV